MIVCNFQTSLWKLDSPWATSLQDEGFPRASVSPSIKWGTAAALLTQWLGFSKQKFGGNEEVPASKTTGGWAGRVLRCEPQASLRALCPGGQLRHGEGPVLPAHHPQGKEAKLLDDNLMINQKFYQEQQKFHHGLFDLYTSGKTTVRRSSQANVEWESVVFKCGERLNKWPEFFLAILKLVFEFLWKRCWCLNRIVCACDVRLWDAHSSPWLWGPSAGPALISIPAAGPDPQSTLQNHFCTTHRHTLHFQRQKPEYLS